MYSIGITGPIGHGKSTFAEGMMAAAEQGIVVESSGVIAEVADQLNAGFALRPLRAIGSTALDFKQCLDVGLPAAIEAVTGQHVDHAQLRIDPEDFAANPERYKKFEQYIMTARAEPGILAQPITPSNKEHYRPFLQWIGGYVTTQLEHSLWYEELLRRGEVAEAKDCGFYIVSGVRFLADATVLRGRQIPIIDVVRPNIPQQDIIDPTEAERARIEVDSQILNNGTLEQLNIVAGRVASDVMTGNLRRRYQAKAF